MELGKLTESLTISDPEILIGDAATKNMLGFNTKEKEKNETEPDTPEDIWHDATENRILQYRPLNYYAKEIRLLTILDEDDGHHVHCSCKYIVPLLPHTPSPISCEVY